MPMEAVEAAVHDVHEGEATAFERDDVELNSEDTAEPLNFLEENAPSNLDSPEAPIPSPIIPSSISSERSVDSIFSFPETDVPTVQNPQLVGEVFPDPPSTPQIWESEELLAHTPDVVNVHTPNTPSHAISPPRTGNSDEGTWDGFKLVGDNYDWRVVPRHQTLESRGSDIHGFQFMAVKDRIDLSGLSDKHNQPVSLSKDFCAKSLLPSHADMKALQRNLCVLVARILTKHLPEFQSLSKFVPSHISHKYCQQMRQKSEVVSITVILRP